MSRLAGVIGSRSLPASFSPLVSRVVSLLLSRGYGIASGGALGADSFALSALLQQGAASRGTIHSAWASASGFPILRSASGFSFPCFRRSGCLGLSFPLSASFCCCFGSSRQEQAACFCFLGSRCFPSRSVSRLSVHGPSGCQSGCACHCVPLWRWCVFAG